MKLSDYHYKLPNELIARYPAKERSASRLLCLDRKTGEIEHRIFSDLVDLLQPNDLLVFNNSKVMPARLFGQKETGGRVEILIERILDQHHALAHVRASKSPKVNSEIILTDEIKVKMIGRENDLFKLKFQCDEPIVDVLERIGHMPLPPYIDRDDEQFDHERYQTVYADPQGSVAAPTAGLHFDETLIQKLKNKKIDMAFLTLHVGAGTFQPVRVDNIKEHHMHAEWITVSKEVCDKIHAAKKRGGRVIAVGTTSVRSLETAVLSGELKPYEGDTDIFIYPGFEFKVVDAMITNFHLPESTLLMLVSAFAGRENILNAYRVAIEKRYRFFSYGDAMYILA